MEINTMNQRSAFGVSACGMRSVSGAIAALWHRINVLSTNFAIAFNKPWSGIALSAHSAGSVNHNDVDALCANLAGADLSEPYPMADADLQINEPAHPKSSWHLQGDM